MIYLKNIFVSVDQFGNVLAGGNPDNTISARIGYYTPHDSTDKKTRWYWLIFRDIVNFTFRPIDGKEHCHEAYHNDAGESYDEDTKDWAVALLFLFIVASCFFISILLYSLLLVGLVSPKNINRTEKIKQRIRGTINKQNGTLSELNEYEVLVDDTLKKIASDAVILSEQIVQKVNEQ